MVHTYRLLLVARWLVPMLIAFLVLGHTCEVPAWADLVSDTTEAARHSAGDHEDENLISCDAVGVPSSTAYLQLGPSLDVAEVLPVARPVPVRVIRLSLDGSSRLPSRPPLFLLHASLLI
jgi:hypothetical protein